MDSFEPRSTSKLRPGSYLGGSSERGRYACGRVLQLNTDFIPSKTRRFFGGLHNWISDKPPTSTEIAETGFIACGVMNIKAITSTGEEILGHCDLNGLDAKMPTLLSAHGGSWAMVLSGAEAIRPAREEEWEEYPILGVWGYNFIRCIAEKRLANDVVQ